MSTPNHARKHPVGTPISDRFWLSVRKGPECWEWMLSTINGYGALRRNKSRTVVKAHRLSWEIHNGPVPAGMYVCHRCDNKLCVRPDHLFLGTHRDNMLDMRAKGRAGDQTRPETRPRGERHGCSKLTASDVIAIRRDKASGVSTAALMARYSISKAHINSVASGRTWRHLSGEA